nr:MAG TPA: head to tail adaptor [Caudoviricetes sp.]
MTTSIDYRDMDNFIDLTDYDSSIHKEILGALVRKETQPGVANPSYDPEIIETCEDRAVGEMQGYLNKAYDVAAIFSARGKDRHALILMYAIDITLYHLFSIHNPYKMSGIRKDRYDRAMEWLKMVAAGDITIGGAPRLPQEDARQNARFIIDSDRPRPTRL